MTITIKKTEHALHKTSMDMLRDLPTCKFVRKYTIGKWHRIYSNGKHSISLIKIGNVWESSGYGSKEEKRYTTFALAVKDIKKRLNK